MKYDRENITPADFTVIVKNLPKDATEDDIKDWFENHPLKKKLEENAEEKLIVNNVCLCYNIGEYVKLARERARYFDYECILKA